MAHRLQICRDDAERARLTDMSRRLRPVERWTAVALAISGIVGIPTFGWVTLLPPVIASVLFFLVARQIDRPERPEHLLVGSWIMMQAGLAVAVAVADGPSLYLLWLFLVPTLLAGAVFPARVFAAGVLLTGALMMVVAFLVDPQAVHDVPFMLVDPVTVLCAAAFPAWAAGNLDVASRTGMIVDRLTGALNRQALHARVAELRDQTADGGQRVSLIIADLDHFKGLNDRHGHAAGDRVLAEVATQLRTALDHLVPVYRFGGEEFVILLTGIEPREAALTAERLRHSLAGIRVEDTAVTASFGVASTAAGERLDFNALFGRADAALYTAKQNGRDRVQADRGGETRSVREYRDLETAPAVATTTPPDVADRFDNRIAAEHAATGNWLIRDDLQRQHLVELNRRLLVSNLTAYMLVFVLLVVAIPTFGWAMLIPTSITSLAFNIVQWRLPRLRHPEYALGIAWLAAQLGNATGIALMSHTAFYALPFLTLMVVGHSAVFPRRGVIIGTVFTGAVIIGTALVWDTEQVFAQPGTVTLGLALVVIPALIGSCLGRSALDHRGAAIVDPLTGLLNRSALDARAAELEYRTAARGRQVAVLLGDLDHFKAINDAHGHAVGDAVLAAVAHRIRGQLRTFESAYRLGGEEFVILLEGADAAGAAIAAQRLRAAISSEPLEGLFLTMSLGVAVAPASESFAFADVMARADAALYEAKRAGRDRVAAAPGDDGAAAPSPALAA